MSGIGGNIRFANPKEPAFLQKIIQETGYKESPTVDTKREVLPAATEEDLQDRDDEKPTVVILESEKVSEEEAKEFIKTLEGKQKKKMEQKEEPFDSSKRIIFQKRSHDDRIASNAFKKRRKILSTQVKSDATSSALKNKNKSNQSMSQRLSFADDNDE